MRCTGNRWGPCGRQPDAAAVLVQGGSEARVHPESKCYFRIYPSLGSDPEDGAAQCSILKICPDMISGNIYIYISKVEIVHRVVEGRGR